MNRSRKERRKDAPGASPGNTVRQVTSSRGAATETRESDDLGGTIVWGRSFCSPARGQKVRPQFCAILRPQFRRQFPPTTEAASSITVTLPHGVQQGCPVRCQPLADPFPFLLRSPVSLWKFAWVSGSYLNRRRGSHQSVVIFETSRITVVESEELEAGLSWSSGRIT